MDYEITFTTRVQERTDQRSGLWDIIGETLLRYLSNLKSLNHHAVYRPCYLKQPELHVFPHGAPHSVLTVAFVRPHQGRARQVCRSGQYCDGLIY